MDKFNDGNIFIGSLGNLFVIITFIAAIVATLSYAKATFINNETEKQHWKKLARWAVYVETVTMIGLVVCLYYILYTHQYQYKFAYKHSDNSLPVKYLFSCFWEGQEGSFMLWIFWHCVLSICIMFSAKQWEAPVLFIVQFVQIFLAAFLLGQYIGEFHIGSSPFVLLRNSDMGIGPIFSQPNYLNFITDGKGLNRTLQDPWMVIHPPTLFFGFASCTIPMAFAIAGIIKKDVTGWVKPALPWTILAACMLGVGILMGAKWAYQSLSFGGYWAWDPVENASLVPWLIIIAGLHTMLIYKHTGYSLRATYLFIILTFVFIIYSTCLTRSGVLGDTSVHSFTGTGIVMQLWLLLGFVTIPPLALFIFNYKKIPTIKKEEQTSSREFWMFIGSIVFAFSALFIIIVTSLPVFNKLFGTKWALGQNNQMLYNNVHIPVVLVITLILGIAQYLKYKNTSTTFFIKKNGLPLIISIVISGIVFWVQPIAYIKEGEFYRILISLSLVAAIYAFIINLWYWADVVKRKVINWGSTFSHMGFALLIVGILISSANQKIVSTNKPMFNIFGDDKNNDPRENLNLIKGLPLTMDKYKVTYLTDTADLVSKERQYYNVKFTDTTNGKSFNLYPNAFLNVVNNGKEGIQPNPDFKNYWNKDLFLYITSLLDPKKKNEPAKFVAKPLKIGDTAFLVNGYFILKNRKLLSTLTEKDIKTGNIAFEIEVEMHKTNGEIFTAKPKYVLKNNVPQSVIDSIPNQKVQFKIEGVLDSSQVNFAVKDDNVMTDYITVKVLEFPNINLIWIGMCIMSIGFMIAMTKRIQDLKLSK